ncbi:hypothetical protein J2X57_003377 [Luteibacter sp. 1214]|nr:hypothetical protein [Luteibacter sp. 1214]
MTMRSTDYALLAENSYLNPEINKEIILDGVAYKAIDFMDNPETGFQGTAYRRIDTNEVVIAYRGTEFGREPVHDGGVDAGMVLTGVNLQAHDAAIFTQRVLDAEKIDAEVNHHPMKVTVTGHSLGGTLAEIEAAKFGLKGETFNAYGAASLFGVPEGGNQVIDHVRAGDVVSAGSPHFGEVRIYADQKDIDTLSNAGYRDHGGALNLRNPVKAIDFGSHAIDNFVPDSKTLGHSIINDGAQNLYKEHEGMIDRYRGDVMGIRKGLSAPWEVPKTIAEEVASVGHAVVDKVEAGVHAVERSVEHAAHEVKEAYQHVKEDVSEGLHAVGQKASHAWDTVTHPSSWFKHDEPLRIDSPEHPHNAMFQQARNGVHKLDAEHGRTPDIQSNQLAGAVTASAVHQGLTRIDHVALNADASRAYAVQGDLNSPFKQVAEVNTQEALSTSIDKSSEAIRQHSVSQAVAQQGEQPTMQPDQGGRAASR